MNVLLAIAALLTVLIGGAHSWLGEKYIITRLLKRRDLPRILGSDVFTRQTIRFAWHLTTIAWCGMAVMLVVLSGAFAGLNVEEGLLFSIAATFGASAVLPLVFTRGRHLSWIVFLCIAVICAYVAM